MTRWFFSAVSVSVSVASLVLAATLNLGVCSATASGQTTLSHYKFDGDLLNASGFTDVNGTAAPHGAFRRGVDSATALVAEPTFVTGVDGQPGGAILFDGTDGWVDVTTAGHPGAPVALSGVPTDDDPQASSGPGLVSGTAMAWVKTTNLSGPRWIMGNLNANPSPPFVFDTQAWLMGWSGSTLQVFPRASGPGSQGVNRFIVSDPTNNSDWGDGQWHHIAFQWNGAAEQGSGVPEFASVYIDGVRLGATSTNYFLDETDVQNAWQFPMAIGARNNRGTLDGFWDGAIDDLRIYSDALTDAQILAIYQEMMPASENADFNADGFVDGGDFLIWQRGFGGGTSLAEGDANNSASVDGQDLAIWAMAFSATPVGSGAQPVPEPAAVFLCATALAMLPVRRSTR